MIKNNKEHFLPLLTIIMFFFFYLKNSFYSFRQYIPAISFIQGVDIYSLPANTFSPFITIISAGIILLFSKYSFVIFSLINSILFVLTFYIILKIIKKETKENFFFKPLTLYLIFSVHFEFAVFLLAFFFVLGFYFLIYKDEKISILLFILSVLSKQSSLIPI